MPDTNFWEWLFQQSGLTAVAILALYMLNAVWRRHCDELTLIWEQTRSALERNTEVLTRLSERLEDDDKAAKSKK